MKTIDELWYGNVSPFEQCTLGDAMHLIHAVLELFECFLLLFRERAVQLLAIPGYQLQQFF